MRQARLLLTGGVALALAACGSAGLVAARSSPAATPATARCSSIMLSASSGSPGSVGQVSVVTATTAGCPAADYRFSLVDASSGVGLVVQGWSSSNTWTWNPDRAGEFRIVVDVRAHGESSDTADASGSITMDVATAPSGPASGARTSQCSSMSVALSTRGTVVAGAQVTATATPYGCGAAEFRFQLVDLSSGVGLVMQDWGPSSAWTWDTTGVQAGRYAIRVDTRAYGVASANPDATAQVEVDVVHAPPSGSASAVPCSAVSLTASPPSPVTAGARVTANATPAGCAAAEFRFQLVDMSTGVGLVMQDWSSSNTWTWDTTGSQPGRYAIRADARAYGVASGNPDATAQVEVDVIIAAPST